MMSWEELVVETRRGPIPELEFPIGRGEIGEARRCLVQSTWTQVHGEPPHLARVAKERSSAHRRQLLQSPLLAPLVLEPHLKVGSQHYVGVVSEFIMISQTQLNSKQQSKQLKPTHCSVSVL
jgi:hypothetical protein